MIRMPRHRRRHSALLIASICICFFGIANVSIAQARYVYDDFNGPSVDPKIWTYSSTTGIRVVPTGITYPCRFNARLSA